MVTRRTGSRFVEPFFGTHRIQVGDKIYRLVGYSTSVLPEAQDEVDTFVAALREEGRTPRVERETVNAIERIVEPREFRVGDILSADTLLFFGWLIYVLEASIPKRVARVAKGIQRGAKKARKTRRKEQGTTSLRGMRR